MKRKLECRVVYSFEWDGEESSEEIEEMFTSDSQLMDETVGIGWEMPIKVEVWDLYSKKD